MKPNFKRQHRVATQSGFGLVELMVAMVIGLVASLAIFQTFSVSEERKRTTTSGSEGLQSALAALTYVERLVVNSGFGLISVSDPVYASMTRIIDIPSNSFTLSSPNPPQTEMLMGCTASIGGVDRRIAPLTVSTGGLGLASDTMTIMAASNPNVPMPVATVPAATLVGTASLVVQSSYGFTVGDWVVVYEQNSSAAINPGTNRPVRCTLARVAGLPSGANYANAIVTLDAGTVAAYSQTMVVNLGRTPLMMSMTVDGNGRLVATDLLNGGAQMVIAEDLVTMKVQLGLDVGGDDIVDVWMNPPNTDAVWLSPANPLPQRQISALPVVLATPSLHQVKSLRLGFLVRSPQFERPDDTGNCTTSPAGPFDVLTAVSGNNAQRMPSIPNSGAYTLAGNQRCFRYHAATSVVPLRNLIMSEM